MAVGVQQVHTCCEPQSRGRGRPPDGGTVSNKGIGVGQPLCPETRLDLDYAIIPNSTGNATIVPHVLGGVHTC